jgi:hypothetical protein
VKRNTVNNINQNDVNILNGVDNTKQKEEKQEKRGGGMVTFTYIGKETWYITKLSQNTTFINSLYSTAEILACRNTNYKDKYEEGEIYQLTCPNCEKSMWA